MHDPVQAYAQLFVLTLPWPVKRYSPSVGLLGRLEHAVQEPELVPLQLLRYWPTGQLAEQLLQVNPFPSEWLHDPERYWLAEHDVLLHALQVLPSL